MNKEQSINDILNEYPLLNKKQKTQIKNWLIDVINKMGNYYRRPFQNAVDNVYNEGLSVWWGTAGVKGPDKSYIISQVTSLKTDVIRYSTNSTKLRIRTKINIDRNKMQVGTMRSALSKKYGASGSENSITRWWKKHSSKFGGVAVRNFDDTGVSVYKSDLEGNITRIHQFNNNSPQGFVTGLILHEGIIGLPKYFRTPGENSRGFYPPFVRYNKQTGKGKHINWNSEDEKLYVNKNFHQTSQTFVRFFIGDGGVGATKNNYARNGYMYANNGRRLIDRMRQV